MGARCWASGDGRLHIDPAAVAVPLRIRWQWREMNGGGYGVRSPAAGGAQQLQWREEPSGRWSKAAQHPAAVCISPPSRTAQPSPTNG
uniref:Uncharacterized protein n=1 Tax=Oryza barthii TaxID=65489 RepID=A0A0D3H4C5_9ORYZ